MSAKKSARRRILPVTLMAPVLAGTLLDVESNHARPSVGDIRGAVSLSGTVTYVGPAPEAEVLPMDSDPYCGEVHFGTTSERMPFNVDLNGGLRDVVVYIREGAQESEYPVPEEDVLLDQEGCLYEPHVVALRNGQTLTIRNSDGTSHNVHVSARKNRGFNIGQPIKGIQSRRSFRLAELPIHVTCDIHGWMHSIIAVFDHPFFAVTRDNGTFRLDHLPPGDYVVEAWHEVLGSQTRQVTVNEGAATEVTFVFEN